MMQAESVNSHAGPVTDADMRRWKGDNFVVLPVNAGPIASASLLTFNAVVPPDVTVRVETATLTSTGKSRPRGGIVVSGSGVALASAEYPSAPFRDRD